MGTPARHACLCFPTSGPWPRTSRHLGDSLPAHPYVLAPTVSCPLGICPFLGQKLGDTVCTLSLLGSCECEREWGIAECKQAPWSTLDGCACPSAGSGSRLRGKQGLQRGQMFPVTARFEARTPPPHPQLLPWEKLLLQSGWSLCPPSKSRWTLGELGSAPGSASRVYDSGPQRRDQRLHVGLSQQAEGNWAKFYHRLCSQGWLPWLKRGNPFFTTACQVSSCSAAGGGAGTESPTFRVKPMAPPVILALTLGAGPREELKR